MTRTNLNKLLQGLEHCASIRMMRDFEPLVDRSTTKILFACTNLHDAKNSKDTGMYVLEVNCVTKMKGVDGQEIVTQIGNNTHRWTLSHEIAMRRIQLKVEAYYTLDRKTRKRSVVGVVRLPGRAPRLGTHVDGVWNDDLLAQVACDTECVLVA